MKTEPTPARWRKAKTALVVLVAIVTAPIVLMMFLASMNEGRR